MNINRLEEARILSLLRKNHIWLELCISQLKMFSSSGKLRGTAISETAMHTLLGM